MIDSGSFPKALSGKKGGAVDKIAIQKEKKKISRRKHKSRQLTDAPKFVKMKGLI